MWWSKIIRFWLLFKREVRAMSSRPLYIFCIFIGPIFCLIFFTTLMGKGLPTDLPVGVCDEDNTSLTREILRNLDAFQQSEIVAHYPNFADARRAMQEGKIYAFYYIPQGTTNNLQSARQPRVSFYTNNAYLIAGSLMYRDLRVISELSNGAVGRSVLLAKGVSDEQAMAFLQPIVIDTHPLDNPWLNYSVYLCNTIFPGILTLLIFLVTIYSIGVELKNETAREWMKMADNHIVIALGGKLAPQTLAFFLVAIFYNVYLYGFLHFPCNSGIGPMLLASLLMVIASQCFGVFLFGLFPALRWALSIASLWGVLSFSMSGFTFPVMAMNPMLQSLSYLFPLRHYYLIYVDQALHGYPMAYAAPSYLALLILCTLPFLVLKRLETAVLKYKYIP